MINTCKNLCYIHVYAVTALCLEFHVLILQCSIKAQTSFMHLLYCCSGTCFLCVFNYTCFTLSCFLKERPVKESEIQTIQRKVRKNADTKPKIYHYGYHRLHLICLFGFLCVLLSTTGEAERSRCSDHPKKGRRDE